MKNATEELLQSLNTLSPEQRSDLDDWLVLHQLERKPCRYPVGDADRRLRLEALLEVGEASLDRKRSLWPWRGRYIRIGESGSEKLAKKREELEHDHAAIGSAIAAGADQLASKGIDPRVFLLERMVLLHGRFDRERSGFFTQCPSLSKHVREFSEVSSGDSFGPLDVWTAAQLMK